MPTHPVSLLDISHGDSEVVSPVRAPSESLGGVDALKNPPKRDQTFQAGPTIYTALLQHPCIQLLNCRVREVMLLL